MAKVVRTQKEVAAHFDVQLSTVRRWIHEYRPPMPYRKHAYNLLEIEKWHSANVGNNRKTVVPDGGGDDITKRQREAKALIEEQKLLKLKHENAIAHGTVIEFNLVENWAADVFRIVRDHLTEIPANFVVNYPPDQRETLQRDLSERLDQVLRTINLAVKRVENLQDEADKQRHDGRGKWDRSKAKKHAGG